MEKFNSACWLRVPEDISDTKFQEGAIYATRAIMVGIYKLALGRAPSDYPRWSDWELELYRQVDKVIYEEIQKIEDLGNHDRV